jgi:hypothetical protein
MFERKRRGDNWGRGILQKNQSERRGSNPRHSAWEADTLPTELRSHI